MNKQTIQGKLRKTRGKIKGRWAKLTSDDLGQLDAKYDEMVGLFQERYGYTQERASKELSHFLDSYTGRKSNVMPWDGPLTNKPLLTGALVLGLIIAVRFLVNVVSNDH